MENTTDQLPDIQHELKPIHEIPIFQVGVSGVKLPIILECFNQNPQRYRELVATVSMGTDLNSEMKGISMSKLHRTLIKYTDKPLKHQVLYRILGEFRTEVETNSNDSYIKFAFEFPMYKTSPKSGITAPQYYQCSFWATLNGDDLGNIRFFEQVTVQYASYCPCSAALCDHLKEDNKSGFPHAQRCFAEVMIEVIHPNVIWLEEIIDLVENAVKNIPFGILRRMDEQELAKIAAENPMFVEDAIRAISVSLNNKSGIYDWLVECKHQESIHSSDAISKNWKGLPNGFRGTYYL